MENIYIIDISIPYGAIKRDKKVSEICKKVDISIPYGAIKRK